MRIAALALVLGACVGQDALLCADGTVCPADRVCAPGGGACADPAQVIACQGLAAGAPCELPGIGGGLCRDALCQVAGCGDGVVDPGEACDDGNRDDTDACTAACAPPTCGDAIVQAGEACDDGVANADDRACTSRCLSARCGDGFIEAGVEECDAATGNADDDVCTTACRRNVCGDGHVFAGVEACDDANTASGDGCRTDCRKVEACGDGALDAGEACDDGAAGLANPADGCDACVATTWLATARIGGNTLATTVALDQPRGVAVDRRGAVFIADRTTARILRIEPGSGVVTTIAGTGTPGYSGDGGPATAAQLARPHGLAVDGLGNVFVADAGNDRVRRIDVDTGIITTVAGTGTRGAGGDGLAASSAQLAKPHDVAVDGLGDLYIADTLNHRVRKVSADTGTITTVAGNGSEGDGGDGGDATLAAMIAPVALALDSDGGLYVVDREAHRVRRIDLTSGRIDAAAGSGVDGDSGDGGPALDARFSSPRDVALDAAGNLYVADPYNGRVRRVAAVDGTISTFAGDGTGDYTGDGGLATAAGLESYDLALDAAGDVYLADLFSDVIRRIDATSQVIDRVAGSLADDAPGIATQTYAFGNDVVLDAAGNLYFDTFRGTHRVDAETGLVTTLDEDFGTSALAIDRVANLLYLAKAGGTRIDRLDLLTGALTHFAGGTTLQLGDGGPATAARLRRVTGMGLDAQGNLYLADFFGLRIRRIDTNGIITTIAGDGVDGFSGDGGPATAARMIYPFDVAVDAGGNVYFSDGGNRRIRRVDPTGIIQTVAGTGSGTWNGDGAALATNLGDPLGVDVGPDGRVYFADSSLARLRVLDPIAGTVTTRAGHGAYGSFGDGGPASGAAFSNLYGVELDDAGNIYVHVAERVRRIDAVTDRIYTVVGQIDPAGVGPVASVTLRDPRALVVAPAFTLFASGANGDVRALRSGADQIEVVAGRYPQGGPTGNLARFRDVGFGTVGGVAYDAAAGRIYLTESTTNRVHAVRTVDPADVRTWTLEVLLNAAGVAGFADGPASDAQLRAPTGLFFDAAARDLYVADTGNHAIRRVAIDASGAAGAVETVAGTGATLGFFGDGGGATAALLHAPQAMTRCDNGDLFIADTGNQRVRRVAAGSDVITTVLGDGVAASSGEGAPAATFPVDTPLGLACDAHGNVFVTSGASVRMLPADAAGIVDGLGAVRSIYGAAPRETFPASVTTCLTGVAIVDAQTLWVTDACAGLLVELSRQPLSP